MPNDHFPTGSRWACRSGNHVGLVVIVVKTNHLQVAFDPTRSGAGAKSRHGKTWKLPLNAFSARYERIK